MLPDFNKGDPPISTTISFRLRGGLFLIFYLAASITWSTLFIGDRLSVISPLSDFLFGYGRKTSLNFYFEVGMAVFN